VKELEEKLKKLELENKELKNKIKEKELKVCSSIQVILVYSTSFS
jgi:hypothetical protein